MKPGKKAGALRAWTKFRLLVAAMFLTIGFGGQTALARTQSTHHHRYTALHAGDRHRNLASRSHSHHYPHAYARRHGHLRYSYYAHYSHRLGYASARYSYSRLQCVPYAREVSHIQLSGDAFLWWAEASGRYARGSAPVEGAVLNFRSIRRMPLGHVAVVTGVIDNRTILVTQANWIRGAITNDVTIEDVSPDNDWSEVEVELGDSSRRGAAYPTYGFIYNQPASTVIAASGQGDEVAEAPRPAVVSAEAPDRNLQ